MAHPNGKLDLPDLSAESIDLSALEDPAKTIRLTRDGPYYPLKNPTLGDMRAIRAIYADETLDMEQQAIRLLRLLMPDVPDGTFERMPPKQLLALFKVANAPIEALIAYQEALFPNSARGSTASPASVPETSIVTSYGESLPRLAEPPGTS